MGADYIRLFGMCSEWAARLPCGNVKFTFVADTLRGLPGAIGALKAQPHDISGFPRAPL
jgi:hypothetical protein